MVSIKSSVFQTVEPTHVLNNSGGPIRGTSTSSIKREFVNRTNKYIGLVTRDGLKHLMQAAKSDNVTGYIDVVDIYTLSKEEAARHLNDLLVSPEDETSLALIRALRQTLESSKDWCTLKIVHAIRDTCLIDEGVKCYLPSLDVVLFDAEQRSYVRHPYSFGGSESAILLPNVSICVPGSMQFSISIIDNSHNSRISKKYINISGGVYPVNVSSDPSLLDGIYVTSTRPVNEADHDGVYTKHYTFEEGMKSLKLFSSIDEAMRQGDSKEIQTIDKEIERTNARRMLMKEEAMAHALKTLQLDSGAANKDLKDMLTIGGSLIGVLGTLLLTVGKLGSK